MARERNSSGKPTGLSLGQQKAAATYQISREITDASRLALVAKQERLKALRLAAEAAGTTEPVPDKRPVRAGKKSAKPSAGRVPSWLGKN